jgi:hypothetical protein
MCARPIEGAAYSDSVDHVLGWRRRRSLRRAVAVERLRVYDMSVMRTPFRWTRAVPFAVRNSVLPVVVMAGSLVPVGGEEKGQRGIGMMLFELLVPAVLSIAAWLFYRPGGMSYRTACVATYWGTLDRLTRCKALDSGSIAAFRENRPSELLRVRDARRWARFVSVVTLAGLLVLACAMCVNILVGLWDVGLIKAAGVERGELRLRALGQVIWSLSDSIPTLDLPSALNWADPSPFRDSRIIDVVLQLVRVVVFGPIIVWIISAFRSSGFDPRDPTSGDPVINHVIVGLAAYDGHVPALRQKHDIDANNEWTYALRFASAELGGTRTPDQILDHLAVTPPGSMY